MHTLQHNTQGQGSKYAFSVHSLLLSNLNIISGVDNKLFFFLNFAHLSSLIAWHQGHRSVFLKHNSWLFQEASLFRHWSPKLLSTACLPCCTLQEIFFKSEQTTYIGWHALCSACCSQPNVTAQSVCIPGQHSRREWGREMSTTCV